MNSSVSKITDSSASLKEKVVGLVSGNYLYQKLEAWCKIEPSVLMWEVSFTQMAEKSFIKVGEEEATETSGGWVIEFNIVRSSSVASDRLFDGVFILSGFIKNSLEFKGGKSHDAYFLNINSRNIKGEQVFLDAGDLWETLTTIGLDFRKK